jgi:hypothetical protein
MIPEEISRERGPEKFELLKMSSENLEVPVKMWLHRKIKCEKSDENKIPLGCWLVRKYNRSNQSRNLQR